MPTNEAIVAIAQDAFGATAAYIMILGFVVALVLARFTPLRYVFLTGHHILFMATLITIVLATANVAGPLVVVVGALLLGVLMVSLPALGHAWTRKITGDDSIAIGHFGTAGYVAAGSVGRLVGKGSRSTEELKLPEGLRFLRDSMVATALSMVLMYLVLAVTLLIRVGQEQAFAAFETPAANVGNYLMMSVTQGLQFGVAVAVILFGVRTILGELVPAFQGIASKVVPGAIPALDAPIVFPYAQNAVLIGFISSFVGGVLGMAVLVVFGGPAWGLAVILPGLVPHFFTGGAAGVYGNATGGRRGAVAGGFVNGLIVTFLPAFLLKVLGEELGAAGTTFGDADFGWFGILIGYGARMGAVLGLIVVVLIGLALLLLAILVQRKVVDTGWDPSPSRGPGGTLITAGVGGGVGGAGAAAGAGVGGSTGVAGVGAAEVPAAVAAAQRSYPRVAPPAGAPVPPPPPED